MRCGVALVLASLALAAPARPHAVPFFWSIAKVMRVTDEVRVRVGDRVVRIEADTTLCSGQGPSRRRSGVRRWRHFSCTYTIVTPRGIGRDVEFRVHVLGVRRFAISDARWVGDRR